MQAKFSMQENNETAKKQSNDPEPITIIEKTLDCFQGIIGFFEIFSLILLQVCNISAKVTKACCNPILSCLWYSDSDKKVSRIRNFAQCIFKPFLWCLKSCNKKSMKAIRQKINNKFQQWSQSLPKRVSKLIRTVFPPVRKYKSLGIPDLTEQKMKQSSNQILLKLTSENKRIYFVPTYLRMKIKNFTAIDLDKLQAEVNVDVLVSFVYGNKGLIMLPKELIKKLMNEVVLSFERDEPIKLTMDGSHITFKEDEKNSMLNFTIRQKLHIRIQSHVYLTPFQTLNLILPITIQQIPETTIIETITNAEGQQEAINYDATIRFNYMDNQEEFVRLDWAQEKSFGNYSLIQTGLKVLYSNERAKSMEHLDQLVEKNEEMFNQRLSQEVEEDAMKTLARFFEKTSAKDKVQNIEPTTQQSPKKQSKPKNKKNQKLSELDQQELSLLNKSPQNKHPQQKSKKKIKSEKKLQAEKEKANIFPSENQTKKQTLSKSELEKNQIGQNGKKPHQKNKKKEENAYYQYSVFKIPIYKHPMASLATIFLPLWSLAVINLGIFFQGESLSQRIASIASLMIAFISLIPTIRQAIPPNPKIVFVELLVYAEIAASFLGLYHSFLIRKTQNYELKWDENWIFITALVIFAIQVVSVGLMVFWHYKLLVPSYEYQFPEGKPKISRIKHRQWRNYQADEHFSELIKETPKHFETHKHHGEGKKMQHIVEEQKKNEELNTTSQKNIPSLVMAVQELSNQNNLLKRSIQSKQSFSDIISILPGIQQSQYLLMKN